MGESVRKLSRILRRPLPLGRERRGFDHPNEGINLDLGVAYIAIPKTGSTSIRTQIRPKGTALFPVPHLNYQQLKRSHLAFRTLTTLGQNTGFPSNGVQTDAALVRNSELEFNNLFKFATVRNPYSRVVSLYTRQEGIRVSPYMTFTEFCRELRAASDTCRFPSYHHCQIDWLLSEQGEVGVDLIIELERLDEGLERLRIATGGRVTLRPVKRNAVARLRPWQDYYTNESRNHIRSIFARDIDYFGYDFD